MHLSCLLYSTIGAGVLVRSSYNYSGVPLPNNSALVWKAPTNGHHDFEMDIYCMSNSTNNSTGSLVAPHGNALGTTFCGVGCYWIYSTYSSLSPSDQGIYTCRIEDSNHVTLDVNFGIYPHGYSCKYCINQQCQSS